MTSLPATAQPPADYYIAPDGSDAAAGTLVAPWRTLAAAQRRLEPGSTLWVRGGTYHEIDIQWTASGTADQPITIRGVPGEQAVFDGRGTEERFLWINAGAGFLAWSDLTITGFATLKTGVIVLTDGAHDIAFRGLEIHGHRGGTQLDHLLYLGAPDVHDVSIEDSLLTGAPGAAVHVYHEPAARSIRISGNTIERSHWGVLLYSGTQDVLVLRNRFIDVDIAVKLELATGVRLIGNTATGREGIVMVGPPVLASYLDQDNKWPRPPRLQAP